MILPLILILSFTSTHGLAHNIGEPKCLYSKVIQPSKTTPKYLFQIHDRTQFLQIAFSDKSGNSLSYTIKIPKDLLEDDEEAIRWMELGDFNFDGYVDIALLAYRGATGNYGFLYLLYNPVSQKYEFQKDWSNLCHPTYFPKEHKIISFNKGGGAGSIFSKEEFLVIGLTIKLVKKTVQDIHPQKPKFFLKQTWVLEGDEMKLTSSSILPRD